MTYGLHNEVVTDFEDIGDIILQYIGDIKGINYVLKLKRIFLRLPIPQLQVPAPLPQLSIKRLCPTFDLPSHKHLKAVGASRQSNQVRR